MYVHVVHADELLQCLEIQCAAVGRELNWMLLVGHYTAICSTARQQGAFPSDLSSASKRSTLTHDESHVAPRHHGPNHEFHNTDSCGRGLYLPMCGCLRR